MITVLDLIKSSSDYVVVAIILLGGSIYKLNLISKKTYLTIERYHLDRDSDKALKNALMAPILDELEKIDSTMNMRDKMVNDRLDTITVRLDNFFIAKK